MAENTWQPAQYNRFTAERRLPFDELVGLCRPVDGVVYDLGCGPGTLTAELADRLGARRTVGVDSSEAMLAEARPLTDGRPDLTFVVGDLATFGAEPLAPADRPDLVFSNAALHWAGDHPGVLERWRSLLGEDGQLAVQVPANSDHPAYRLAAGLAEEVHDWFPDGPPALPSDSVAPPEDYARILHELGAREQHVAMRVFPHRLANAGEVVEWVKGTTLLPFRTALSTRPERDGDQRFEEYCAEYRRRLLAQESPGPYLFTFKRVLFWARF